MYTHIYILLAAKWPAMPRSAAFFSYTSQSSTFSVPLCLWAPGDLGYNYGINESTRLYTIICITINVI